MPVGIPRAEGRSGYVYDKADCPKTSPGSGRLTGVLNPSAHIGLDPTVGPPLGEPRWKQRAHLHCGQGELGVWGAKKTFAGLLWAGPEGATGEPLTADECEVGEGHPTQPGGSGLDRCKSRDLHLTSEDAPRLSGIREAGVADWKVAVATQCACVLPERGKGHVQGHVQEKRTCASAIDPRCSRVSA